MAVVGKRGRTVHRPRAFGTAGVRARAAVVAATRSADQRDDVPLVLSQSWTSGRRDGRRPRRRRLGVVVVVVVVVVAVVVRRQPHTMTTEEPVERPHTTTCPRPPTEPPPRSQPTTLSFPSSLPRGRSVSSGRLRRHRGDDSHRLRLNAMLSSKPLYEDYLMVDSRCCYYDC